jgi:hypothetical protein
MLAQQKVIGPLMLLELRSGLPTKWAGLVSAQVD